MAHYFEENHSGEFRQKKIEFSFDQQEYSFYTSSEVFSGNKVDRGSEVLLIYAQMGDSSNILDLGCGYGVLGIVIAKKFVKCKIIMSDINRRALDLAKKNLVLNKIENAEVIFSDLYQHIKGKFDTIISNPPNTAGKELCFKLIDQSIEHLNQSGTLQIVARPNKGGKELAKRMKKVFGNVEELGRKSEYHVYKSVKA